MMPEPELRYASAREFADDLIMFRTGGPVRALTEDLEATRRTVRHDPEPETTRRDEETRRTTRGYKRAGEVVNWPPAKQAVPRKPLSRRTRQLIGAAVLAIVLYAGWHAMASYVLYKRGQQLETAIATEEVSNPNEIWTRWTELSQANPSSVFLQGPRSIVKQHLLEAANRVIANYRNTGAVSENGWRGARDNLAHVLSLGPDEAVRGDLRLAEGHLERISGEARHRQADLDEALEKFTEAARLLPNSPDPPLAEARLEIQSLKDFDRGYAALQQAEKHGYTAGRERLLLADGYRLRADHAFWETRTVRDLPQEKDIVESARDDYNHALDLYRSVAPYGNSSDSIQSVEESLASVNSRLNQIEHPAQPASPLQKLRDFFHIWR
jgi:tetratricopeptide (TPR) repeat protein